MVNMYNCFNKHTYYPHQFHNVPPVPPIPPPIKEIPPVNHAVKQDKTDVIFELFGLKIYFDDLLLICILIFLYQEGIQDDYLFIALILLLLS